MSGEHVCLDSNHHRHPSASSSHSLYYDAPNNSSPPIQTSYLSTDLAAQPSALPASDQSDLQSARPASPDPDDYYRDDYYRQHLENETAADPVIQPKVVSKRVSDESSPARLGQYRSVSDAPYRGLGHSKPPAITTPRSRQTSFKDLINKFNKNNDQILPIPSAPSHPSGPTSPVGSTDGSRSRASSRLQDHDLSPTSRRQPLNRWSTTSEQRPPTSHPQPPNLTVSEQRAFGDLLKLDTSVQHPSAIPSHMRRRGSEGSIPGSPFDPSEQSPLTPTAWYLGKTPYLEAVSNLNPNSHRRVQSDFSRNSSLGDIVPPPSIHMAVPATPSESGSPESPHSKSRIPVSRRSSPVSGSDIWTSPKASTSFSGRSASQVSLPPKGASRLPKPSPKYPPRIPESRSFSVSSADKREVILGRSQSERNTHLPAYIATSPLKKSPTLRSSRPRKSVNTGPIPRSKVNETVSNFQRQINRGDSRSSRRERRLPEIGHVDFATRRQKIQQAFNQTVQENEKKAEEAAELQRRASVQEQEQENKLDAQPEEPRETPDSLDMGDTSTIIEEPEEACHDEKQIPSMWAEGPPQLHLDTDISFQERMKAAAEAHLMTMDSPTLGLPFANKQPQTSDKANEPTSAVTAASGDTHVTAFDPEPQTEVPRREVNTAHRTLFSQIMQIRESSPSSSSCDEPDYSFSDNEEGDPLPIMLQNTRYDESAESSDHHDRDYYMQQQNTHDHEQPNRWSMSSWTSSLQNRNSTDGQCEGSGDELSQVPASVDESEVTTQSCSAASSTPPSVTQNHYPTIQPPSEFGPELPKNDSPPRPTSHGFPSGPSLVRAGGWNSTRVTQLYFEELSRGRSQTLQLPAMQSPPQPRSDAENRGGRTNSLTDDPVVVPGFDDVTSTDQVRHSATLSFRDDWVHASPSIADWMQVAADDGDCTPSDESHSASLAHDAPTPRLESSKQQSNNEGAETGLGLAINVQPPEEAQRPPPQPEVPQETQENSEEKSGEDPPPAPTAEPGPHFFNAVPNPNFAPLGLVHSTGSSDNSSLRRFEHVPSLRAVDSSVTSLVPSNPEQASIELQKSSPSPEQRRLKKRRHVIKELVDTEYNFGRDMKVVDDIYKGTSSSCLDLSADDVKILFANSDQVVQFSMAFQDTLKAAAKSVYVMPKSQRWASKRSNRSSFMNLKDNRASFTETEMSELEKDRSTFIGQAFVTHIANMEKVYSEYLKNHDAANKKLQALQKNPKVAIWLKECRDWASDLTTAWDLDSLLVKPVQRILKYPLLLTELLDSTPSDHPDRASLTTALEEVTSISVRINEMKKRADLVGQVVGRKRKESDVRAGLSKAFGRRTEKFRQQVGLSDIFEDKQYDSLNQRFGDGFFQLQVVMRDVEMYTREAQGSMERFEEFVSAIEGFMDVQESNYPDLEARWRQFRMCVRGIMTGALPDHLAVVRKSVIDPMLTLLKLHEGPQMVMRKRDKRLMDYARFKAVKDRGDKPDKKTCEQAEQFTALNDTLKDELPKLYALTAKMMEACLNSFVHIQATWMKGLEKKIEPFVDVFPDNLQKMINDWAGDFTFSEAQVLSLGICNGSLLADTINLVNFNTPPAGIMSPRRSSAASTRVGSMIEESPKASHDFSTGSRVFQSPSIDSHSMSNGRHRTDSTMSGRTSEVVEVPRGQLLQQITNSPESIAQGPSVNTEPFPSLPQLSLDSPFTVDVMGSSNNASENPPTPGGRYSGFFSSAMPMSDTPEETPPAESEPPKQPKVLFLAASIYEFNIDRARREAGYPYLTYVAGEIFDVIAEKGELWLAKNQDDSTGQVGWIWNKHFAKLSN